MSNFFSFLVFFGNTILNLESKILETDLINSSKSSQNKVFSINWSFADQFL